MKPLITVTLSLASDEAEQLVDSLRLSQMEYEDAGNDRMAQVIEQVVNDLKSCLNAVNKPPAAPPPGRLCGFSPCPPLSARRHRPPDR